MNESYEVVIQSKSKFFKDKDEAEQFIIKLQKLVGDDTELFLNEVLEKVEVDQKMSRTKVTQIDKFPKK